MSRTRTRLVTVVILALLATVVPASAAWLQLSASDLAAGSTGVPHCMPTSPVVSVTGGSTPVVAVKALAPACAGWQLQVAAFSSTGALVWRTGPLTVPSPVADIPLTGGQIVQGSLAAAADGRSFTYVLRQP